MRKKKKKTRSELAALVAARLGVSTNQVAIHKNEAFGWDATLIVVPTNIANANDLLHRALDDLRGLYELSD
jgi:hypothetical protein